MSEMVLLLLVLSYLNIIFVNKILLKFQKIKTSGKKRKWKGRRMNRWGPRVVASVHGDRRRLQRTGGGRR